MEGWALYTEQLAAEKDFHKSWHSYLGYLDYQLLRSCRFVRSFSSLIRLLFFTHHFRLVVDTGIHWKRWSREEAIDYMVKIIEIRMSHC